MIIDFAAENLRHIYRKVAARVATPSTFRRIHPDFEGVARKIVRESLGVKRGETVLIRGRDDNLFFCEHIGLECRKVGAQPVILVQSDQFFVRGLMETPLEFLGESPRPLQSLVQAADVIINTGYKGGDPALHRNIPEERMGALRRSNQFFLEEMAKGGKRGVFMGFPTPAQARLFGVDFNLFHNMFWKAMDIDNGQLSRRAGRLADKLSQVEQVTLVSHKGTNLRIRIGDRRICKHDGVVDAEDIKRGDGFINLPSGEVFLAPLEDGANGRVVFDLAFHRGHRIEDLEVEFVNGRAIPRSAKTGLDVFRGVLANARGDKDRIGELGFGLNPAITRAVGQSITDEKMLGTIHVALGENRFFGGNNDSDLHWDLMILAPTVFAGKELLTEKGRLTL